MIYCISEGIALVPPLYEPIKRRIDIQMALEVHPNQLPKSFNPKIENQILPIFSKIQSSNDHHLYKYKNTHSLTTPLP